MSLIANLKTVLNQSKLYSLDFGSLHRVKNLHLRFWELRSLVDVEIARLPRDFSVVTGKLTLIAQKHSAVCMTPQIVPCSACNAEILKALDQDPNRPWGFWSAFSPERPEVKKLLVCGPSCDALGGINMFSLLQTLIGRLTGAVDE